jgi:hypothetical protein
MTLPEGSGFHVTQQVGRPPARTNQMQQKSSLVQLPLVAHSQIMVSPHDSVA